MVTFADSVLHLVRAGARIDRLAEPEIVGVSATAAVAPPAQAPSTTSDDVEDLDIDLAAAAAQDLRELEPGLADLEAAVALVAAGLATRVVLSGFTSWPGLLWRAYQLAETTDVLILPTVVRPGGKVDIAITRDHAPHG